MTRPSRIPAVRRAAVLAAAVGTVFAGAAVRPQPSPGCPVGDTCPPAADVRSVPLADSGYNSWTLDFDIAVLKLKGTLTL